MARLVVVDPDKRIRGALARLISTAGHLVDEFDDAAAASVHLTGAELVFVAAGPGGSAIDPSMAAFEAAAQSPKVVWTGPVAAMIQPAVAAGVGVDCLELPARLPALKAMLSRHIARRVGDSWSGDLFLRKIEGKGDRFPPIRVLFLAHRLGATGVLHIGSMAVVVKQGKIADATGVAAVGGGGGLMQAIGAAVGQGKPPDAAMQDAGVEVLKALVQTDADALDVRFAVEEVRAPVVLPTSIPRLLTVALQAVRPASEIKRELAGRPSRGVELNAPADSPENTWGLSPVSLRVVRASKKARNLGELVSMAGGAEKESVWEALDFLLHLGLLRFLDSSVHGTEHDGGADDAVFSDIVIEAVQQKPVDPRVAEYRQKAEELEQTPPWELFGVDDPANVTTAYVDEHFRKLSAQWHPDRFAGVDSELADAAAACFAAYGDARDRFSDEDYRNEVRDRLIAKREGRVFVTEADAQKARMALTRGEHAARRKEWDAAIPDLTLSVELDPRAAEAHFQLCMARWRSGSIAADEAAALLAEIHPNTVPGRAEARFQEGEAHLAAGNEAAAYQAFAKAVDIKADHVGAARRLRMRARRGETGDTESASKKPGGLRGIFGWGRSKS